MLINARSLCNKLPEFHNILSHDQPSIVIVTETWLTDVITDGILTDGNSYSIFRRDRVGRHGGGVCICINNDIF
jgi:hypothetical protein